MPNIPVTIQDPRSLGLAVAVTAVALVLLIAQEFLGRSRDGSDPIADPARTSRRRGASLLMAFTGLTMAAGSVIGSHVGRRPNLTYVLVWLLVLAEVSGLLVFAWLDLAATRRIARTVRESLRRENLDRIEEEIRRHRAQRPTEPEARNGHPPDDAPL